MWKTAFEKFDGIGSAKSHHSPSIFLKIVFHKFCLVHSWILCPVQLFFSKISGCSSGEKWLHHKFFFRYKMYQFLCIVHFFPFLSYFTMSWKKSRRCLHALGYGGGLNGELWWVESYGLWRHIWRVRYFLIVTRLNYPNYIEN